MIEDVVSPVLHDNAPVATEDNVDVLLQLSTELAVGADGIVFGADVPVPDPLPQPLTVWATL